MIDVRELKPGNLVLRWGQPAKICGTQVLDHTAIVLFWNGISVDQFGCQEIHPIPLTPEWLGKMGFQTQTMPDAVDDEGDIIKGYTHWTNGRFCFHFSDGKVEGREHIQFVHLFQNWYYFSTFEELQIKQL